jgi:hypothetical protein
MSDPVQDVIKEAAELESQLSDSEIDVDLLKEAFTVDLFDPVTVDGVTYHEITFDFAGMISADDVAKYEKQYQQITGNRLDSTEIADRVFQEFFLRKASGLSLGVFRGLGARDKRAVYNLALEYLGKISIKTKRRKRQSNGSS